jgi:hypothetical protein
MLATAWLSHLAYSGPNKPFGIIGTAGIVGKIPGDFAFKGPVYRGDNLRAATGLADYKVADTIIKVATVKLFGVLDINDDNLFGFVGSSENNKAIYVTFRGTSGALSNIITPNWWTNLASASMHSYSEADSIKLCSNNAPAGSNGRNHPCTPAWLWWPETCAWTWGSCKVGAGFYDAYLAMQLDVRSLVANLRATYPEYEVICTGHSLGTVCSATAR